MYSKDYSLGKTIKKLLITHNLEAPMLNKQIDSWHDPVFLHTLTTKFSEFLTLLGFDLTNHSLEETPKRVIKFFITELFYGLDYHNFPKITLDANSFHYQEPLFAQNISINSTCEHHLVSIHGIANFAYIPHEHIIGLSKINRVIDFFAKRPQLQERLTRQIFFTFQEILKTNNIAIVIKATHDCIAIRGIKDVNTYNTTSHISGEFLTNVELKNQLFK